MRLAAIGVFLLVSVSTAWAVEPCLDNDCEVVYAGGTSCCEVYQCYEPCPGPACGPEPCQPKCGKCRPKACEQECEPDCPFGMDALMQGPTEIPMPDGAYDALDPDCCPRQEFRRIPCEEWCNEYTTCCWPLEYKVLCQDECSECPPPPPKCRQDTCTQPPDCAYGDCRCVDTSCGIDVG
jgi:hypothetical protein